MNITGIILKHGCDDLELWTDFALSQEEENTIKEILERHQNDGTSIRGTKTDIIEEIQEPQV